MLAKRYRGTRAASRAGGAPVPVGRGAALEVSRGQRTPPADLVEDVRHRVGMPREDGVRMLGREALPGEPEPGQLRRGQEAQHLVETLEQLAALVEQLVRPRWVVVAHASVQDEVVIPT